MQACEGEPEKELLAALAAPANHLALLLGAAVQLPAQDTAAGTKAAALEVVPGLPGNWLALAVDLATSPADRCTFRWHG